MDWLIRGCSPARAEMADNGAGLLVMARLSVGPVPEGATPRETALWALAVAAAAFENFVPVAGKPAWRVAMAILTSPIVLLLHLTNPSLELSAPPLVCCACGAGMIQAVRELYAHNTGPDHFY